MLTRRMFLKTTAFSTLMLTGTALGTRTTPLPESDVKSGWVDHIPVSWAEPKQLRSGTNAVIWLPYLGGRKEDQSPRLRDLAASGFLAVSFDPWQHGERGSENDDAILKRIFGNFRRHMWPILGQTTLDSVRVIDWLLSKFPTSRSVHMGGMSMGGDIAVAAAGIDDRVKAVAAIVATPDWLRPGMRDLWQPSQLLPPGTPDGYARYFYEQLNPMTHLSLYGRGKAIAFECAANDTHVPPAGALRFKEALRGRRNSADVRVTLHPGLGHRDLRNPVFWEACLEWFKKH
jgi:hypothetical protein